MKRAMIIGGLLALASLAFHTPLQAATWDGGGTNNNWTTANNWNPNGAPVAGDSLAFPGGTGISRFSNNNDFPALTGFENILFSGPTYTLGGNAIQLNSGILAGQTNGTNVLTLGVTLAQDQSFTSQNTGAVLRIDGAVNLNDFVLTLGGQGNLFLNGVVSGTGSLVKEGPGFTRLTGNNTYSGDTTVAGGTLEVNNASGSGTGSGSVTVESSAELQGNGVISGDVLVKGGGKISPGDDEPAILGVGDLALDPSSVLVVQLNGPVPDTEYSGLDVTGTVSLSQAILRLALGPDVVIGDDFEIIDNDSTDDVIGNFNNLEEGETFRLVGNDDIGFKITYQGGDGNDVVLSSIPTLSINDVTINEPASGTISATFVVLLNEISDETVTVEYATSAGTATASEDYVVTDGVLTFDPGVTSRTVAVTIKSDALEEGAETFSLLLFNPTNASIAVDAGEATIQPSGGGGGGGGGTGDPSTDPLPAEGGCSLHRGAAPFTLSDWALFIVSLVAGIFALRTGLKFRPGNII